MKHFPREKVWLKTLQGRLSFLWKLIVNCKKSCENCLFPTLLIWQQSPHSAWEMGNSHLSSLATLPLCSSTSQTQATCSWVKPKEVMVELVDGGVGRELGELEISPPPSPDNEGKLEKLERHWPTPGKAEIRNTEIENFQLYFWFLKITYYFMGECLN